MGCCDTRPEAPAGTCPSCGARGRAVGDVTLDALLLEPARRPPGPWRFCRTPDCEVVYFSGGGDVLRSDALAVRVGIKERAPDRPICYCFGHSAADLAERPAIRDEIKAACKRGEDRCPQTNPRGACCLGDVGAVIAAATQAAPA